MRQRGSQSAAVAVTSSLANRPKRCTESGCLDLGLVAQKKRTQQQQVDHVTADRKKAPKMAPKSQKTTTNNNNNPMSQSLRSCPRNSSAHRREMATGESRGRCAMASVYGVYRVFFYFLVITGFCILTLILNLTLDFAVGSTGLNSSMTWFYLVITWFFLKHL